MKRILLASVAALGLAGTASAADLAVKAPVVYAPVFTWTGCYLGINGGWIGGNDDYTTSRQGALAGEGSTPADVALLTHSYSSNESAGTAGGQFGCQAQLGSWVIGGEWDWNWSGLKEDNYFQYGQVAWASNPAIFWNERQEWTHKEVDWFSTARVRLGLAWDRVLLYATGGLAYAAYDAYTEVNFNIGTPSDYFGAYREKRFGWTAGGGIEWAFANNWTAKAEFLYLDFGSFGYDAPRTTYNGTTDTRVWHTNIDATEYVARVGINYLFHTGGAPVVARY